MKREDLQKIEGLSKEQIESIMNLHQVDAEQHKKDLDARIFVPEAPALCCLQE